MTALREQVRLAELVASLSLATDLGLGQPMEHVMRSCIVGLRLAELLELEEAERAVVYYVALLAWVGCHADSHEQAAWFGDDIVLRADRHETDLVGLPAAKFVIGHVGRGRPPLRRALLAGSLLAGNRDVIAAMEMTHCLIAGQLAVRLGLGDHVHDGLQDVFERWDGKGFPRNLEGEEIALSARIVELADIAEVFRRIGGLDHALEVARRRRGTQFDPKLVDLLVAEADTVFAGLDEETSWTRLIESEPALAEPLNAVETDTALEAIADFADLKSPYTTGHSRGVAELAARAGASLLGDGQVAQLRRAALMHDMGRLGIPNTIWDKPGRLSEAEMERVRLYPYLLERMFTRLEGLAEAARLAGQVAERLDGSGYPRALTGAALTPAARVLQAADVYQALSEPRAHRAALEPAAAAAVLRAEVAAGRLDSQSAEAVLGAAGHRVRRRPEGPNGLTPREVEVLVLLAQGAPTKEIATRLVISPKTAGTHIEHIYSKIGCSTRAAASLYAMQHGLLPAASSH